MDEKLRRALGAISFLDENAAHQLCGLGCIQADAKFRPCHAYLPAERYDVKGLDSRSRNDPGRC